MINVLGLIASPLDPSSRFRISQYAPLLLKQDIQLRTRYHYPSKDSSPAPWAHMVKKLTGINQWRIWNVLQDINRLPLIVQQYNYDLIWQSRMLLPYLLQADRVITRPVIFDLDDAIWLTEGKERTGKALAKADMIFVGNDYLADWAGRYNQKLVRIPTTVDTNIFYPIKEKQDQFTIGWIGSPSNFKYLSVIEAPIRTFLERHENARFMIISSEMPAEIKFSNKVVFSKWNPETENEMINKFSIGIMPLTDDEWTRGKCGFKLIQYMACGKAVVASPVGVNNKLLEPGTGLSANHEKEWLEAFESLFNDEKLRLSMGTAGRELVQENYNAEKWSVRIAGFMKEIKQ